jgi:hypothetical protein
MTFACLRQDHWLSPGSYQVLASAVEGGSWALVVGVEGATLDVAPKMFGFAGIEVPKVLEGLGGVWGL